MVTSNGDFYNVAIVCMGRLLGVLLALYLLSSKPSKELLQLNLINVKLYIPGDFSNGRNTFLA